jgi:signal transduction histidine kinase
MTEPERSPILNLNDAAVALRTLPYGGIDDSTRALRFPPAVQATVSPVIVAIRWGAAMFGMVFAAFRASTGDRDVVKTLIVVLFLTTWRTMRPIRLGATRRRDLVLGFTDAVLVGAAVGLSGGFDSPFIFSVLAVAAVAAFGWGVRTGLACLVVGMASIVLGLPFTDHSALNGTSQTIAIVLLSLLTVVLAGLLRDRLLDAEGRRASLAGRVDLLSEANDLLHILNQLARTLPMSLDLREAMSNARQQIQRAFDAEVVALVVLDDLSDEWTPQIAEGCALRPSSTTAELPEPLRRAAESSGPLLVRELDEGAGGVGARSRSGLYTAIKARGRIVGVLGVEHRQARRYSERDLRIMEGLSDVLALTVDNARSFRRLRTLGAEEERSRIARDLHDRLGQWLSYISFELERIITTHDEESPELDRLYGDVQTAIDELRETLRQLRSGVTEERPLARVAGELVERFNSRGPTVATLTVTSPDAKLPVRVENELLRVLQESLSNVSKHAHAERVEITWDVADGVGRLTIADDGRGFDAARGVRDSAYGLVGMRERADVVGARIAIDSSPGRGTTVTVVAGRGDGRVPAAAMAGMAAGASSTGNGGTGGSGPSGSGRSSGSNEPGGTAVAAAAGARSTARRGD